MTYGENLTKRWDPNNIIDYLHNLNKNCSRQTKHSNIQFKKRKLFFKNVCKLLNEKTPVKIEQQENKKFSIIYDYDDKFNICIVIAIKDKFININTRY